MSTKITVREEIGGFMTFGIIGLFIGPVVLAVTHALIKAWVSRSGATERVFNV